MLNEVTQERVGETVLIRPLSVAEYTVKSFRIGFLDAAHGLLQRLTHVCCNRPHVAPVTIGRNLETVVLRKNRVLFVTTRFRKRSLILLVVHIRDPFKEKERKDIGLEVC